MRTLATLLLALSAPAAAGQDAGVPLIPRELLFGNPEREAPALSPDGKQLAWLAPDAKGVQQVWVRPLEGGEARVVTADPERGLRGFQWARDSKTLLYGQDTGGDEAFHVYAVDVATKAVRDLTPWPGARATVLATSARVPNAILVASNRRDPKATDAWRIALDTGAATLEAKSPGDVNDWYADQQLQVRAAVAVTKAGGTEIRVRDAVKAPWRPLITASLEERLDVHGFSEDGRGLFVTTSVTGDTARLVEKNLKSGAERLLGASPRSDVMGLIGFGARGGVRAVAFDVDGRLAWTATDPAWQADLDALRAALAGDFEVLSQDDADARWVVAETRDTGPVRYWLYERKAKAATLLFSSRPKLEGLPLAPMKPVTLHARDGLALESYLTLPLDRSAAPGALVLLVHGGPWGRDTWGYDGQVQWLANRGYSVLQVNFRGSAGYGKRFLNAGNRQWGRAMHEDLLDAVAWAVKEGVADPKKVGLMGTSYGGYATLAGLAFSPGTFACGVDVVGPANLFTLLASTPPWWEAFKRMLLRRMGDPDDPADKALLTASSPLFAASRIRAPLLIGQGQNDPRVKPAESEQIVAAMEKNGLPVTYVLYPDEGHGFARPENRLDFIARAEGFLGAHLGGRVEPLPKDGRVPGSTARVRVLEKKQP